MGGAVFAEADGIVSKDVERRDFHQGSQTNAGPHVIAEVEESAAESARTGKNDAGDGRGHGVFANAEVQVAASVFAGLKISGAFKLEGSFSRGRQIGGAANQPWNVLRDNVQDLAGTLAGGNALGIGGKVRQVFVPPSGQFAALHVID